MTPPPSLGNIRDDDKLLDALGGRQTPSQKDDVGDLLASWVAEIDSTGAPAQKTRRPRMAHLAAATGLAVTALSVSSMAAAVTDYQVPVLYQLGSVAGSVLGSPLHAAGGGGDSDPAPEQGLPAATSETSDPPSSSASPSTTSTGKQPTDLPRSTTSPRPSTHEKTTHEKTTAHGRPPANPAPSSTPDSPSSPDRSSHSPSRPSTSTSTPSSSSSTDSSSSTSKPDDSSSSTDPASPTPTPTESESESNSASPRPTDPERTRPTLPRSSTSPSTSSDGPLEELEKSLPLPPMGSSTGR